MNEDTNDKILNDIINKSKNKKQHHHHHKDDKMSNKTHSGKAESGIKHEKEMIITKDMRSYFKGYQSTSRTLLRRAWFFDFTRVLFRVYPAERELTMADLARRCYEESGLAAKHPWYIKNPAKWAMGLIASRKDFNKSFCEEASKQYNRNYTEEDLYADCEELAEQNEGMSKLIWKFFKERG